jgi:hypothetical protein
MDDSSEPVVYREEVLPIMGAPADIVVDVPGIRALLAARRAREEPTG